VQHVPASVISAAVRREAVDLSISANGLRRRDPGGQNGAAKLFDAVEHCPRSLKGAGRGPPAVLAQQEIRSLGGSIASLISGRPTSASPRRRAAWHQAPLVSRLSSPHRGSETRHFLAMAHARSSCCLIQSSTEDFR